MKKADAVRTLRKLDRRGRAVFTVEDLRSIFPERSDKTFSEGLRRLARQGVLQRVARGVYVNPRGSHRFDRPGQVALALRRGRASYLSLETVLGFYGVISQQTPSVIMVMTTGRKGRFCTPWGTFHFTHTERSSEEILDGTMDIGRPLRWATPRTALEDLRRTRRNLEFVDTDFVEEIEQEMGLPPPDETAERALLFWRRLPRAGAPAKFNSARRREDRLMHLLARVAAGDIALMSLQDEGSLRQLGYAASLVEGYVDDPQDNLGEAIRLATEELEGRTATVSSFRDPVQARWGAQWHLDAAKLRLETPLQLLELQRGMRRP